MRCDRHRSRLELSHLSNKPTEEVNGRVAAHAKAIEEINILHAQREKYCPLVASIETQILSLRLEVAAVAAQQRETTVLKAERCGNLEAGSALCAAVGDRVPRGAVCAYRRARQRCLQKAGRLSVFAFSRCGADYED